MDECRVYSVQSVYCCCLFVPRVHFFRIFSNLQRFHSWIVRRITGLRDDALGEKNAFLKKRDLAGATSRYKTY